MLVGTLLGVPFAGRSCRTGSPYDGTDIGEEELEATGRLRKITCGIILNYNMFTFVMDRIKLVN